MSGSNLVTIVPFLPSANITFNGASSSDFNYDGVDEWSCLRTGIYMFTFDAIIVNNTSGSNADGEFFIRNNALAIARCQSTAYPVSASISTNCSTSVITLVNVGDVISITNEFAVTVSLGRRFFRGKRLYI